MEKTGLKHIKDESDKSLALLSSQNNEEAYAELVKRYIDKIKSHVQILVPDTKDVEDITQEVFTKAFKMIKCYNPKFAFSTWLYTIARNSAIDFTRKSKLNTRSLDDYTINIEAGSGEQWVHSPEEHLIFEQEVKKIHRSIDALPEIYRTVARMRFIQEFAYEEIAKELTIPISTVKTRIRRAKAILQKDENFNIQLLP